MEMSTRKFRPFALDCQLGIYRYLVPIGSIIWEKLVIAEGNQAYWYIMVDKDLKFF